MFKCIGVWTRPHFRAKNLGSFTGMKFGAVSSDSRNCAEIEDGPSNCRFGSNPKNSACFQRAASSPAGWNDKTVSTRS